MREKIGAEPAPLPGSTLSCVVRYRWSQTQVLQRKVPGIWENMFFPLPPTQLFQEESTELQLIASSP